MLIILKPIFLQDNIFLIPLSIIFYVNGQKFQTFLSIDFCTQKNQLDDSWFLLYLQNYIHVDISLRFILPAILGQALTRLVTVSSMCYHTSTSALSTSSSSRGLTTFVGISHLEGGFTLRCLQRVSRPDVATLPCTWWCNRYTSGPSIPVLSY